MEVDIYSLIGASEVSPNDRNLKALTKNSGGFNNAFPSSSPDGNKFVFRSTRDGGEKRTRTFT